MEKKTKRRKKYPLEAKDVAAIVNVSESYVKQVRTADTSGVNIETEKARVIREIDIVAAQNQSLLIQELKKIVKLTA